MLKADGLAAGKGVVIARTEAEARATIDAWMRHGALGAAAGTLIVEECLEGEESSVLVLTDGERWMLFPPARDHKRIGDGDTGPNTGGMGTVAPARVPSEAEALAIARSIVDPPSARFAKRDSVSRNSLPGPCSPPRVPWCSRSTRASAIPKRRSFCHGVRGPLPALPRRGARRAKERHGTFVAHSGAAVCVVWRRAVTEHPETGDVIEGMDGPWPHGVRAYAAGVDRRGTKWVTSGGRALRITARAETVERARAAAYAAVKRIRFEGMQYRRDIAATPQPSGARADER